MTTATENPALGGWSINAIRRGIEYPRVQRALQVAGFGSICGGILALAQVFAQSRIPPADYILAVLGVVLIGEGAWLAVKAPTPRWLLLDGVVLAMVGSWNLFVAISASDSGGNELPRLLAQLGVFQIGWSVQSFWKCRKYWNPPESDLVSTIDSLRSDVSYADPVSDQSIIEFSWQPETEFYKPTERPKQTVRGQLRGDMGVFVVSDSFPAKKDAPVYVATKRDIVIASSAAEGTLTRRREPARIGAAQFPVQNISVVSMDRYRVWKFGEKQAAVEAARSKRSLVARHRRSLYALAGYVLTGLVLLLILARGSQMFRSASLDEIIVFASIAFGLMFIWATAECVMLAEAIEMSGYGVAIGVTVASLFTFGAALLPVLIWLRWRVGKVARMLQSA